MKNKEYLRHELLDRAHLVATLAETALLDHRSMHPGNKAFKPADRARIKLELEAAADHLMAAYQIIGEIHL